MATKTAGATPVFGNLGDRPLARARMFEIRHFIMDMPNSDETLMLYYHYVKGEPVERCGELLGISRSSAFRLKAKALALAQEKLRKVVELRAPHRAKGAF